MRFQPKPQVTFPVKTSANGIFMCPKVVGGSTSRISSSRMRMRIGCPQSRQRVSRRVSVPGKSQRTASTSSPHWPYHFCSPFDCHKIMGRNIGKRRPGLHVVRVVNEPAAYGGLGSLTLYLPGLFGRHPERSRKFDIVLCPPGLNKMFHDGSVSSLHQCILHIISPPSGLRTSSNTLHTGIR
jgi:hypothetical protein